MGRGCSDSSWALMQALVQEHTPGTVLALMQRSVSGDVPSFNAIKQARTDYLQSQPQRVRRREPQGTMPVPVRKPPRPPLSFEEKLARVAAGAALITVRPLRKPAPDFTLGGVASASL
ncbi:hypothetical protein [Sphingomonas sp. Leaf257]|uniref:hypothetical protein n=1 Tax=Sphingomonas sp. Leaf257 TaxID=1736309 RepID=UPI0006FEA93A|nr:hypothetical protein [Sphingomonas sp. Leaf257]KQO50630.1 hypothetical protein ASF14_11130 [Sphingomonas sp. Leaf257]